MSHKLLGTDSDGEKYYLIDASWDCGWYWGYGYIESRYVHRHAEEDFNTADNQYEDKNIFTGDFLVEKTFTEKQGWQLRELMSTFYQLKEQAYLVGTGGMHISKNPLSELFLDVKEAKRINEVLIPRVTNEINKILEKGNK